MEIKEHPLEYQGEKVAKKHHQEKLKILHVASELTPIVKAGGLGDVIGSLPKALVKNFDVDIRIMIPLYKVIDQKKWQLELIMDGLKIKLPNNEYNRINVFKTFIPETKIRVYFINLPKYFSGESIYSHPKNGQDVHIPFTYFSRAVMEVIKAMDWRPDVINVHSWLTAMISKWLKTTYIKDKFFKNIATVLTIHVDSPGEMNFDQAKNLGLKRGDLKGPFKINNRNNISILGEGILNSDMINTVSPTYAYELLTKKSSPMLYKILRTRKKRLTGILNGIDYSNFDPRTNDDTPVKYWIDDLDKKVENKLFLQKKFGLTQSAELPLVCVVSRIAPQKGLDLIEDVLKDLVNMGGQFIILGEGWDKLEKVFIKAEKDNPKAVVAKMHFDGNLAQTIYAGSDMLLMPSRFEPCGLSQIIAMRFGTIPIVRKTGGLADTVRNGQTGFVFKKYEKNDFLEAINRAIEMYYNHKDRWREMQIRAMKKDFSWSSSARKYMWLYKKAIRNHKEDLKNEELKNKN